MITSPTVFVLGAGASVPYGFPAGAELRDRVCGLEHCEEGLLLERELNFSKNEISTFASALRRSSFTSVDLFLESRPSFLEIGKAAIAAFLVGCEHEENLFPGSYSRHRAWYHVLLERIRAPRIEDLDENEIGIVTLNYDRSLEQFLFTALTNAYNLDEETCAGLVKTLAPIHIYGKLGHLPWEGHAPEVTRPYANRRDQATLKAAVSGLRVVHEGVGAEEDLAVARDLIARAENVYLVGFGFHPVNIERLGLGGIGERPGLHLRGTALGLEGAALMNATLNLHRGFELFDGDALIW